MQSRGRPKIRPDFKEMQSLQNKDNIRYSVADTALTQTDDVLCGRDYR